MNQSIPAVAAPTMAGGNVGAAVAATPIINPFPHAAPYWSSGTA